MENNDLQKKLDETLNLQDKIEEKMKFIEENSDNLSDQQLMDLAEMISKIEEALSPEVEKIKKEMEDNANSIREKAQQNNGK